MRIGQTDNSAAEVPCFVVFNPDQTLHLWNSDIKWFKQIALG